MGDRGKRIIASSRQAWATKLAEGQAELPSETLSQKKICQRNGDEVCSVASAPLVSQALGSLGVGELVVCTVAFFFQWLKYSESKIL